MEYKTIKCKNCGVIFSSDKEMPKCPACKCSCNRKEKDATDFYEVKFKCPHCEKFVQFEKGIVRCPHCNKIITGLKYGEFVVKAYGDINEALKYGTTDEAISIAQYDLENRNKFKKTDDKTINMVKMILLVIMSVMLTISIVGIIKGIL